MDQHEQLAQVKLKLFEDIEKVQQLKRCARSEVTKKDLCFLDQRYNHDPNFSISKKLARAKSYSNAEFIQRKLKFKEQLHQKIKPETLIDSFETMSMDTKSPPRDSKAAPSLFNSPPSQRSVSFQTHQHSPHQEVSLHSIKSLTLYLCQIPCLCCQELVIKWIHILSKQI